MIEVITGPFLKTGEKGGIAMFKKSIFAILLIAMTLFYSGYCEATDCKKAEGYFNQAIEIKNLDAVGLIKAEQLYRKAVELCLTYAKAHNNLGYIYEAQGRIEEAVKEYKEANRLKPDEALPYFGLGDIYFKTGQYKEAIEAYRKGLKYDPNDSLAQIFLSQAQEMANSGVVSSQTIRSVLFPPVGTRGIGEVVSLTFGTNLIPFDFNRYDIRSDAGPQLDQIGNALSDISNLNYVVEIIGHTDIRGTDEYNLNLSDGRAGAVKNYLVDRYGIPQDRLITKGYGERKNICTSGASETVETPCNALNRRVEIARVIGEKEAGSGGATTRGIAHAGEVNVNKPVEEPAIVIDTGFFYQRDGGSLVNILKSDTILNSKSDKYFIFFRPVQDCYVYVIQKDSRGNFDILYPKTNKAVDAYVRSNRDYWLPGFGECYTLDHNTGNERIYLVATSQSIESDMGGLSLEQQVKGAIDGLMTRMIKVVGPADAQAVQATDLKSNAQKINDIIQRIQGQGGWVKVVEFRHE